jgi:hypothetical protein
MLRGWTFSCGLEGSGAGAESLDLNCRCMRCTVDVTRDTSVCECFPNRNVNAQTHVHTHTHTCMNTHTHTHTHKIHTHTHTSSHTSYTMALATRRVEYTCRSKPMASSSCKRVTCHLQHIGMVWDTPYAITTCDAAANGTQCRAHAPSAPRASTRPRRASA